MDSKNIGKIIKELRKQEGYTQKTFADLLSVSDKTVSKWERGIGIPDVSLLEQLSSLFGVNMHELVCGKLEVNKLEGVNVKKTRFYFCDTCKNIITTTNKCKIYCCSKILSPLVSKKFDDQHNIKVEQVEDELYITSNHPMTKEHFFSYAVYVYYDKITLYKFYPEQLLEFRIKKGGKLYIYCNKHGLMEGFEI